MLKVNENLAFSDTLVIMIINNNGETCYAIFFGKIKNLYVRKEWL